MRLVAFTLPNDPAPRTGAIAHDGARVVDLTEIGVASFADGAARAARLARLAGHLLHMPGAVAHAPGAVRLLAPARRLAAVYDAATLASAALVAAGPASALHAIPYAAGDAVPLDGAAALGVGLACVLARDLDAPPAADEVEAAVAGLALVACWRVPGGRVAAAALGPWVTTLDEFDAARPAPLAVALDAALAVNGAPVRGGSWAALSAKLAPALADAARRAPLAAGDAVAAVTFEAAADGAGAGAALGATPGDAVRVEATALGALGVTVGPARHAAGRPTER